MSEDAPAWVSVRAVAWVIDEAPVPADLAFTLLVIARRCDQHGRGSYQSKKTLAEKTGKSVAQVARDIERLMALGLLLLGDQSLPEQHGVPVGLRTTVYDVPLEVTGAKPAKKSRNPTGRRKEAGTPGMEAPPASMPPPCMEAPPPPRMEAPPTPRMDAGGPPRMEAPPIKTVKNNQSINPPAELLEARRLLAGHGLTDDEFSQVIQEVRRRAATPIGNLVRYLEGMAAGDLDGIVSAVKPAPADPRPNLTGCDRHPQGARDDTPEGGGECLICKTQRLQSERRLRVV